MPSSKASITTEIYLADQGCTLVFNHPHSSHMGGLWKRMIGITCRILDAMFMSHGPSRLTHKVLTTFMAEAMAIINTRSGVSSYTYFSHSPDTKG